MFYNSQCQQFSHKRLAQKVLMLYNEGSFLLYRLFLVIPGSSSGRTEDSGSSNGGSNPSPGNFLTNAIYDLTASMV